MHYAGYKVDGEAWQAFARSRELLLIEDAAHAAGAPGIGEASDAAVFSFFGNKNMTTAEGGMVLARDPDVRARVRRMRSHGMTTTSWERSKGYALGYDVPELGFNYRMDSCAPPSGWCSSHGCRNGTRNGRVSPPSTGIGSQTLVRT